MLVLPTLSRICFLLLPVTVVGRPANPSSLGKSLDIRQSHHNTIEGFHGAAGRILPTRRKVEDAHVAIPALGRALMPPSGEMTHDIKARAEPILTTNITANATSLSSGETEVIPFDKQFGPLEVVGSIDLDNLDLEVVIYIAKIEISAFRCNLKQRCEINIDVKIAKGTVELYVKNKNDVWIFASLSLPFGKHFTVDKKILTLPKQAGALGSQGVGDSGNGSFVGLGVGGRILPASGTGGVDAGNGSAVVGSTGEQSSNPVPVGGVETS